MYEKYKSLLDKTNKTSYQVSKETGIRSKRLFTNWKNQKICNQGTRKPQGSLAELTFKCYRLNIFLEK
mgnify:CR=1 FL=1